MASRRRRRTKLRTCAFPTRLLTVKPTRLTVPPFGTAVTTNHGWDHARPSRRTRAKSLDSRSRCSRGNILSALYRQLVAPFQPAGLQYAPSIRGCHPGPEAVLSAPFDLFRLPRSFHEC